MPESVFRFKQFEIHQERCAMKVGTDAVLLGAWVNPLKTKTLLDIGTGTGIIAIMLAQKGITSIDAIDINRDACIQADENVKATPWAQNISIY